MISMKDPALAKSCFNQKNISSKVYWEQVPNPTVTGKIWHKVNYLGRVKQGWSLPSPKLVAFPKLKKPSLPYYLTQADEVRTDGFKPFFPKTLAQMKNQTAVSTFWTQIIDSIYFGDNRCARSVAFFVVVDFNSSRLRVDVCTVIWKSKTQLLYNINCSAGHPSLGKF